MAPKYGPCSVLLKDLPVNVSVRQRTGEGGYAGVGVGRGGDCISDMTVCCMTLRGERPCLFRKQKPSIRRPT